MSYITIVTYKGRLCEFSIENNDCGSTPTSHTGGVVDSQLMELRVTKKVSEYVTCSTM